MTPIRPTLARRAPRGMEMARLGSREMREFIEAEAIDIFTTMTNGGCTFQQSLAAIFLSGMNAAESARRERKERTMPDIKLYDYQRERVPEGTKFTCYWTPPTHHSSVAHSTAPWKDAPLICGFYDEKNNLIGTRLIRKDGTWEDL